MTKPLYCIFFAALIIAACSKPGVNPFFTDWDTPFGTPPFSQISEGHYLPAFEKGIEDHRVEIDAIVNSTEPATFTNTIEAMERSGDLLGKVSGVFYNLNSANTNDSLQSIARTIAPMLSKHRDDIRLNAKLFTRIKNVYDHKDELGLTPEQMKLLDDNYKAFVRGGANLDEEKKEKLREINKELSLLSLKFGENVLKETNRFEMVIDNESDLAGLPEAAIKGAAEAARERGHEGKWVFTTHKPSMIPFLQYSEKRHLREKIYKGYINRGDNNDELDNKQILTKMAALRVERAHLLGYKTHAHFILEENMAKEPDNVYDLLKKLWKPALKVAKQELKDMQAMIYDEGEKFKLESWDWWYYAEKVKKAKYDLDEEMLRPYFQLENVRQGAFDVATKLWGLQFVQRDDIPTYHEDVVTFEVKEADGSHVGILYTDYFPRASKRGGAWMNNYREQSIQDGKDIRPVICNIGNFSKPVGDKPALLSVDEVGTLFHEFGHALHGLLSQCTYESLSGTNVPRDFVELPSQIMENWASDPEVMQVYAKHYETGESIPAELIQKIKNAGLFNIGFATVEYLAASFLDMDWHTLEKAEEKDAIAFENKSLSRIGLIPEIISRYRSPYFQHIFAGGYSSGYYSYMWAEVLDADAFQAFKETSLYDQEYAKKFRDNILAAGGTGDAMEMYKRFRGREPKIDPLLKRKGLN